MLDSFQKLKWADERRFLVKSLPGIARSQQAKRLGKPPLFSGMQFCLWGDYEAPSKEEIASIVETGGGKVLPQLPPVAKTFQEVCLDADASALTGADQRCRRRSESAVWWSSATPT